MSGQVQIKYITGDASQPHVPENETAIICHIVNNINRWGKGFVMALSARYPHLKPRYHAIPDKSLGKITIEQVGERLFVANLFAQNGIDWTNRECLTKVADYAKTIQGPVSFHMPRIGCGLAGGKWEIVEGIVKETLPSAVVYTI
jgi:hypothetical protein